MNTTTRVSLQCALRRFLCTLLLLGFILPSVSQANPLRYAIVDLGHPAESNSQASAINNLGKVVGYSLDLSNGTKHAFYWTNSEGMVTLGGMTGSSIANDINESGVIVGSDNKGPYLWTINGGRQTYRSFGSSASAAGINDAGTIAGYVYDTYAYTWSQDAGYQNLGVLNGGTYSFGSDINNLGQVAGRVRNGVSGPDRAGLWDPVTGWQDLGAIYLYSEAFALNDHGQVVGESYIGNGNHAFLWDATNGLRDLGTLTTGESSAYDINESGQVVGVASFKAFLWQNNTMYDLNSLIDPDLGWNLRSAYGINDLGQIVGEGKIAGDPYTHAFLLTPIPEPSIVLPLIAAVVLLAVFFNVRSVKCKFQLITGYSSVCASGSATEGWHEQKFIEHCGHSSF